MQQINATGNRQHASNKCNKQQINATDNMQHVQRRQTARGPRSALPQHTCRSLACATLTAPAFAVGLTPSVTAAATGCRCRPLPLSARAGRGSGGGGPSLREPLPDARGDRGVGVALRRRGEPRGCRPAQRGRSAWAPPIKCRQPVRTWGACTHTYVRAGDGARALGNELLGSLRRVCLGRAGSPPGAFRPNEY